MNKPTMRDTKETILAYVKEQEEKINALKANKFDPKEVKEVERKKEVTAKAETIVKKDILNPEIIEGYNALQERIKDLESTIKTLTGIEVNVNTLAALIEANNIEIAQAQTAKDEILAEKKAELAELQDKINSLEETRKASEKEYQDALKVKRQREEEEYNYDTKKKHRDAEDKWNDELAAKKKVIADKEAALEAREEICLELEVANKELIEKVNRIPEIIESVKATAEKEANDKTSKTLAIKEAALKKEVTVDLQLTTQELIATKAALAKSDEKIAELENKLAQAYRDMNTLASTTVQAARPVYLEKEVTSK